MRLVRLAQPVKQELEIVLESALMLSAPGISLPALAKRIYDSERALIEKVQESFVLERLIWMLSRKRSYLPAEGQYVLPGFHNFPERMTFKDGRRLLFIQGNFGQLLEFRDVLLKRRRPRLFVVEKFISLMEPYAAKRGSITVGEVILLEKAKLG